MDNTVFFFVFELMHYGANGTFVFFQMDDLSMDTVIQTTNALLITLYVVKILLMNILPLLCIYRFASAMSVIKIMEITHASKHMVIIISLYIY